MTFTQSLPWNDPGRMLAQLRTTTNAVRVREPEVDTGRIQPAPPWGCALRDDRYQAARRRGVRCLIGCSGISAPSSVTTRQWSGRSRFSRAIVSGMEA